MLHLILCHFVQIFNVKYKNKMDIKTYGKINETFPTKSAELSLFSLLVNSVKNYIPCFII